MDTDILVIGAGPAGLAVAATLKQKGREPLVIEKAGQVGASWRNHYERLHLHTVKTHSALPGRPFAADQPRYVPRRGVVEYLQAYADAAAIQPRFGEEATAIRAEPGGGWRTETRSGNAFRAASVVVTTGANNIPVVPTIAGDDVFGGRILHSREYRSGAAFVGQRVLVVGMGNTGAEIALDLAEHGVAAALSVRSPVNIVRRDVLGRPTQLTSLMLSRLPTPIGDALARFFCDLTVGDLRRYGLQQSPLSPMRQLREHGRTPVIDAGTLARIAAGEIAVHPGIRRLEPGAAEFVDGRRAPFDAIVLATGYRSGTAALFPGLELPVDDSGLPTRVVGEGPFAGVYFIGFDTRKPGGLLRTIALQAVDVAERICALPERPSSTAR